MTSGAPAAPAPPATINVTSLWGGARTTPSRRSSTTSRRRPASRQLRGQPDQLRDGPPVARSRAATRRTSRSCRASASCGSSRKDGSHQEDQRPRASIPRRLEANYPPGILDAGHGRRRALRRSWSSSTARARSGIGPTSFKAAGVTAAEDAGTTSRRLITTLKGKGDKTPLALGAKDSWTLTDWFESIYLRQAGVDAYDKLFSAGRRLDRPDRLEGRRRPCSRSSTNDNVVGGINGALGRAFDGRRSRQVFEPDPDGATCTTRAASSAASRPARRTRPSRSARPSTGSDFPTFGGSGDTTATIGGDVIAALTDEPGRQGVHPVHDHRRRRHTWAKTGAIISPVKARRRRASIPNDLAEEGSRSGRGRVRRPSTTAPTCCRPAPRTWAPCSRT